MERDELSDETFMRIVGRRVHRPIGAPPDADARAALARMASYLTRAPKGIFRYRNQDEANADSDRWRIAAMVAARRDG
jgi:hypothetical protein